MHQRSCAQWISSENLPTCSSSAWRYKLFLKTTRLCLVKSDWNMVCPTSPASATRCFKSSRLSSRRSSRPHNGPCSQFTASQAPFGHRVLGLSKFCWLGEAKVPRRRKARSTLIHCISNSVQPQLDIACLISKCHLACTKRFLSKAEDSYFDVCIISISFGVVGRRHSDCVGKVAIDAARTWYYTLGQWFT